VDTTKVAAELGVTRLGRATPEFVRSHTGQAIGGVSPIDHPGPLPTYIDPWLRKYDEIWAAASAAVWTESGSTTTRPPQPRRSSAARKLVIEGCSEVMARL
jgi:hypothetical protein